MGAKENALAYTKKVQTILSNIEEQERITSKLNFLRTRLNTKLNDKNWADLLVKTFGDGCMESIVAQWSLRELNVCKELSEKWEDALNDIIPKEATNE